MKRRPVTNPSHDCPGGCGAEVPYRLLSCRSCWWLLPQEMRRRISNGTSDERLDTVSEALVWYKDNVRGGVPL